MARRNRQDEDRDPLEDVASLLAPVPVPGPLHSPGYTWSTPETFLNEIDDLRRYHPDPANRSPFTDGGTPANYETRHKPVSRFPSHVAFEGPGRVLVCVRRKQRREVIFAKKKHGKGGRARRHRRNYYSNVRC